MSDLYRIIYVSECRLPGEQAAFATATQHLLTQARDWNAANATTGALMFSMGRFAQVLEGPKTILQSLLGRIACDGRHRDLRLLESHLIPARAFSNWSMAYSDGNDRLDLSLTDFIEQPASIRGATIFAMLRDLVAPEKADGLAASVRAAIAFVPSTARATHSANDDGRPG